MPIPQAKMPMTEAEWEEKYGWLPTERDGDADLLSESTLAPAVRKLLEVADPKYIWSQQDASDGGYEIVPGFYRTAIGWYVCQRPWSTGKEFAKLPPTEEAE